jgi:VanZ family protein
VSPVRVRARPRPGGSLKPFRRPWLWSGAWIAAIAATVVLSLAPAPALPAVFPGLDKLQHFATYALLGLGAVQLFERRAAWVGAGLALVLLGIGLEYAQGAFTTWRQMDRIDALANTLGVITGLASWLTPWRDALLRLDGGRLPRQR